MFVRMVSAKLKVNQHKQFSELFQDKVIPLVRSERGFRDMMLLGVSGAPEVVVITFWDSRETMEASERNLSPKIQEILVPLLERPPEIKTFTLAYSTMHHVPAEQMMAFQNQAQITTPVPGVGGG